MRTLLWIGALALLLPAVLTPATGSFHETPVRTTDRTYLLAMQGTSFNGFHATEAPLLEAFVGDTLRFVVVATEQHTFHLHGHPWLLPDQGNKVVDTFLVDADTPHTFDVTAGGLDREPGDWMYHCHIGGHMDQGMWGILRVYPFGTDVLVTPLGLTVTLDRLGEPLEGAALAVSVDGVPIAAHVEEHGHGVYRVHAALPATGALVVEATHPAWGTSVARAALDGGELPALTLHGEH